MSAANQFSTDATALKGQIDRQIGKISAIVEITDRPRYADKLFAVAGSYQNVGLGEHPRNRCSVIHWASLGQCGSNQDVDEFVYAQIGFKPVVDHF